MEPNLYKLKSQIKPKVTSIEFLSRILNSRNEVHIMHLQAKTLSIHLALEAFYEEILDIFDELVETYQAKNGILTGYKGTNYTSLSNPIEYMIDFLKFLTDNRSVLGDTDFENIIDTAKSLTKRTIYKLQNLK